MKKTLITASLALLLSACATSGGTSAAATAEDATSAIAAAEAARTQAAAVGYEWRDTSKMLEEARKAAKEQKYNEAVSIASKAERQSMNALKQQKEQLAAVAN